MHTRSGIFALLFAICVAFPAFTQDIDWPTVVELVQNFTKALDKAGDNVHEAAEVAIDYYEFINSTWPDLRTQVARMADLPAAIRHTGDVAETAFFVLSVCILGASLICILPQILEKCRRLPYTSD